MKNMRPRYVTAKSTTAVVVTPVTNTNNGRRCTTKNGIDETQLTRSSGGAGGAAGSSGATKISDIFPYRPVRRGGYRQVGRLVALAAIEVSRQLRLTVSPCQLKVDARRRDRPS